MHNMMSDDCTGLIATPTDPLVTTMSAVGSLRVRLSSAGTTDSLGQAREGPLSTSMWHTRPGAVKPLRSAVEESSKLGSPTVITSLRTVRRPIAVLVPTAWRRGILRGRLEACARLLARRTALGLPTRREQWGAKLNARARTRTRNRHRLPD